MLLTKFCANRPAGPREEDCLVVSTIYGRGGHLGHVTRILRINFHSPTQVKVILGSSFEQTMMGWSPKCYIPSFVKTSLPVLEKKIFEWFLPYMGMARAFCELFGKFWVPMKLGKIH